MNCPNCGHRLKMMATKPATQRRTYRCLGGCQRSFTTHGNELPQRKPEQPRVQA